MYDLGLDVGFGFTKATDGASSVTFKSLVGEATDIQFWSSMIAHEPMENLHVAVDGKQFFVGDMAERQSTVRYFTLDQSALFDNSLKVLALTAMGSLKGDSDQINLVTGLPVGYYKQYKDRLSDTIKGMQRIDFHSRDGARTEKSLIINRIQIMPQPFGTLFHLIMNEQGRIINPELAKQKVGIVDVGFRTTDITISDGLRYVERGSKTADTGIAKAFSVISKKLVERTGVTVELYRLYEAVTRGSIKIKGKDYLLKELKEQIFGQMATVIAQDLERLWADDWDIDAVLLTGGGGAELADHLKPLLPANAIVAESNGDTRMCNSKGYLKFARWTSKSKEETAPTSSQS